MNDVPQPLFGHRPEPVDEQLVVRIGEASYLKAARKIMSPLQLQMAFFSHIFNMSYSSS